MNRTAKRSFVKPSNAIAILLLLWGCFSSSALTPIQFTGLETNNPLQRIITMVVVPPSTEQLRDATNLTIQPNITIKPTPTNYPIVSVTSADYDIYLAGIKQVFRISVPDTNVLQQWYLLIKGGLTTYNYTNPIPILILTNGGGGPIFVTNLYVVNNLFVDNSYTTNAYITNLIVNNITNNSFTTTNVTIEQPGGLTNFNAVAKTVAFWGHDQELSSVPNAGGVLTNDGTGTVGWTLSLAFDELDVRNAYLTNTFVFLTNAPFLRGDGNGQIALGVELPGTNVLLLSGANITFTTNLDGTIVIAGSGTAVITIVTNNTFVNTNVLISTSNSFFNNTYITNEISQTVTNNTFVNTNVFISTSNSFFSTSYITNAYITNLFVTNINSGKLIVQTIFSITNYADNLTVTNGITNLALTANTIVKSGAGSDLESVANAAGALTNNGSGTFGYYNHFVPDTRTITVAGTANQVASSASAQDLTANRTWTVSLTSPVITPGNLSAPQITNTSFAASGVVTNDANGKEYTTPTLQNALLANSSITIQGSAVSLGGTTLAAGASPYFNAVNITNLTVQYTTNAIGSSGALTFGLAYTTNLQASVTLPAFTLGATYYETLLIDCTNSTGSDTKVTMPAGVTGTPGSGTPPVFYCTNKLSCTIYVQHYGTQKTNCWKIDWAP